MNFLDKTSKLVITNDFEKTILEIKEQRKQDERIYIYPKDNILIDDIKSIIKHAYISSEQHEYITLNTNNINIQAQNAFLKILEEPPENKYFLLIANTKSIFLPTILSRLTIFYIQKKIYTKKEMTLNIDKMTLNDIFKFIKENQYISKQDALDTIEAIFHQIYNKNINLPQNELDRFDKSIKLINLNSKPVHIISIMLLKIQQHLSQKNVPI